MRRKFCDFLLLSSNQWILKFNATWMGVVVFVSWLLNKHILLLRYRLIFIAREYMRVKDLRYACNNRRQCIKLRETCTMIMSYSVSNENTNWKLNASIFQLVFHIRNAIWQKLSTFRRYILTSVLGD